MKQSILLLLAAVGLAGCSWLPWVGDDDQDEKSQSLPPLDVPPDLSVPEFDARLSIPGETVQAARPAVVSANKEKLAQTAETTTPQPPTTPTSGAGCLRWSP